MQTSTAPSRVTMGPPPVPPARQGRNPPRPELEVSHYVRWTPTLRQTRPVRAAPRSRGRGYRVRDAPAVRRSHAPPTPSIGPLSESHLSQVALIARPQTDDEALRATINANIQDLKSRYTAATIIYAKTGATDEMSRRVRRHPGLRSFLGFPSSSPYTFVVLRTMLDNGDFCKLVDDNMSLSWGGLESKLNRLGTLSS